MSLNSNGGLQNLVNICQLIVEPKRSEMSKNFADSPYNLKYVLFD
jgi:hypothetical protein